jgi:aspartate 1-decarboxylase
MFITLMKSKIHHATVTQADVHYEGSITIDAELMKKAHIVRGERVQIVNINNAERLETYVIPGEPGTGVIGLNGPAALKCEPGHVVHIISYVLVEQKEVSTVREKVIILNNDNTIKREIIGHP